MNNYPIKVAVGNWASPHFKALKIRTTAKLLDRAAKHPDRNRLAKELPTLDPQLLLHFVNTADLLRVHRLGVNYIALLRMVKVMTVRELRDRNPENLHDALLSKNTTTRICKVAPSPKFVASWVKHAKKLDLRVTYR